MNIPMSQGFDTNIANAEQNSRPARKNKTLAEIKEIQQSLVNNFKDVKDPRVDRTKKHLLTDILVIAILAIIAGAQGWEDIENYGISKQVWLEQFLELPHGIPSDDTFRRMFESINPIQLEQCFNSWINTLVTQMGGQVIPIDGKTVRGSYDRNQNQSALHLISAWASEQRLVLAQMKVDDKSNEITAIPALLELIDIAGSIITIDAMGTQVEIAQKIIDKKADYILTLKANHPTLFNQVEDFFQTAQQNGFSGIDVRYDKRIEKGHHRIEIREVWTIPVTAIPQLYQPKLWPGLKTIVMVHRIRHLWNKTTSETHYYLTSLDSDAQIIGKAIRQHWEIENKVHWSLDCTFGEDICRIRSFHSPRNFSLLRRLALNAVNRESTYQRSLRQKLKRAAMDNDYMLQILLSCFPDSTLDSSQPFCQA